MLIVWYTFFLLDIAVTYVMFYVHGHSYMEMNPLFLMVGGNHYLFLSTLLLNGLFWLWLILRNGGVTYKWFLLSFIVWISATRILAIINNIIIIFSKPVPVEVAETLPIYAPAAKLSIYSTLLVFLIFTPIILQWITFALYRIDYRIEKKGEE